VTIFSALMISWARRSTWSSSTLSKTVEISVRICLMKGLMAVFFVFKIALVTTLISSPSRFLTRASNVDTWEGVGFLGTCKPCILFYPAPRRMSHGCRRKKFLEQCGEI
jgi:hypothetical protein